MNGKLRGFCGKKGKEYCFFGVFGRYIVISRRKKSFPPLLPISLRKIVLLSHKVVTYEGICVHVIHTSEDIYVHVGVALAQRFYQIFHLLALR